MQNKSYVQEKIFVALLGLVEGDGDFTTRLEGATISGLVSLNRGDLANAELDEQLALILALTSENIEGGHLIRSLDYGERRRLVEAMLSLSDNLAISND